MPIDLPGHSNILIADPGPLLLLSRVDALALLHQIGGTVAMPDLVRLDLESERARPQAPPILSWIANGFAPGSETPVRVENTGTGEALRLARLVKPDFRMRDGGEVATSLWLSERIASVREPTLVLHENGKVPGIVGAEGRQADISVVTTFAFLRLAERRGVIPSCETLWKRIERAGAAMHEAQAPSSCSRR